jgi:predicted permease
MAMGFLHDLRYAVRDLSKNIGFTAIVVLTLAAGIGANSAMFSVIRGVLLNPLPYSQAGELYRIFYTTHEYPKFPFNPADFLDYRARNRVFESLAVFTEGDLELSDSDRPRRLTALRVSKDYFHVLGAAPLIGRDFEASDEILGNQRVVILSYELWTRRFSADRGIVGRKVLMDGEPFTVIGVAPAGFKHCGGDYRSPGHGTTVDAWWPFSFGGMFKGRGSHFLNGIGRLKAGITAAEASNDMNRIAGDLGREYHYNWRIFLVSLRDEIVGKSQRMLVVLLGAVAFVLLIACVNVAGLLLVRATARSRDMAVRAALGASRMRLIGASAAESLILALLGAAGGSLIVWWGIALLSKAAASTLPRADMIRIDPTSFVITLGLSLVTGLIFAFAPAIGAAHADLRQTLSEGARGATAGSRQSWLRSVLVVGEIGLASALLIGAGLFLRSFVNLLRLDPGFQTQNVITATVVLPESRYKDSNARDRFFHDFLARVSILPGVRAVGASSDVPWTGYDENAGFIVEGRPSSPDDDTHARYHSATPDYFRAIGIPLLAGRSISEADDMKAPYVIVVNNSMARRYWPGENAVGKRITFSDHPKDKDWFTVVGIVGDVKDAPSSKAPEPAFWWSQSQQGFNAMLVAVRTSGDPIQAVGGMRNELAQMDRELPLSNIRTMEQIAGASRSGPRFVLALTGIFAALALALAAIGTYGVIAYSVTQRMHEFGLRIALGARNRDLLKMVFSQGLRLAGIGIVLGLALSWALGQLLRSLLYEVDVHDPATFVMAAMVSLLAALIACFIPAKRATEVDPMISLRSE